MSLPFHPFKKIYVDESTIGDAGRGMFAVDDIAAGEVIEACPVLALESWWVAWVLRLTPLRNYFYQWVQIAAELLLRLDMVRFTTISMIQMQCTKKT